MGIFYYSICFSTPKCTAMHLRSKQTVYKLDHNVKMKRFNWSGMAKRKYCLKLCHVMYQYYGFKIMD